MSTVRPSSQPQRLLLVIMGCRVGCVGREGEGLLTSWWCLLLLAACCCGCCCCHLCPRSLLSPRPAECGGGCCCCGLRMVVVVMVVVAGVCLLAALGVELEEGRKEGRKGRKEGDG